MKWSDLFYNPDDVGESEYRAIHDCIAGAIFELEEPNPQTELTEDEVITVRGMVEELRDWSQHLLDLPVLARGD